MLWYVSHQRAVKALACLRTYPNSTGPSLFAYKQTLTERVDEGTLQNIPLVPLDMSVWAIIRGLAHMRWVPTYRAQAQIIPVHHIHGLIEIVALCKGGNLYIHIWVWFGDFICYQGKSGSIYL